jgi:hypothetical protein
MGKSERRDQILVCECVHADVMQFSHRLHTACLGWVTGHSSNGIFAPSLLVTSSVGGGCQRDGPRVHGLHPDHLQCSQVDDGCRATVSNPHMMHGKHLQCSNPPHAVWQCHTTFITQRALVRDTCCINDLSVLQEAALRLYLRLATAALPAQAVQVARNALQAVCRTSDNSLGLGAAGALHLGMGILSDTLEDTSCSAAEGASFVDTPVLAGASVPTPPQWQTDTVGLAIGLLEHIGMPH